MSRHSEFRSVSLAELLAGFDDVVVDAASAALSVDDLTQDSRAVTPGSAFLAVRGRTQHGLAFAAQAAAAGARAILWEPTSDTGVPDFPSGIVGIRVPDLARRAGPIADRFFGAPSTALWIAGITGTNGKTTVAWLVAQALANAGRPAGYIGTLGAGLPQHLREATHTTADAVSVHRELARQRAAGAVSVAMEVSSHALDQQRIGGVRLRSAAFTNLTRDHLDYHGTMQAYGEAKARLFNWPGLGSSVVNIDDEFGAALARSGATTGRLIVTGRMAASRSLQQQLVARGAGWARAERVTIHGRGMTLLADTHDGCCELTAPLIGEFNADNLLCALGLLLSADLPLDLAARALEGVGAPVGRMETFASSGQPLAVVDYAHTPDALSKALRAVRAHCSGRIVAVFGCGGDRDSGKRPLMGAAAAEFADSLVLTDDNPRSEPPQRIVADIQRGLPDGFDSQVIHDREAAILAALAMVGPLDAVLIAGKGHEEYQIVGAERRAFSDQAIVRRWLVARAGLAS
jgi:UDP-N-acetylmuramoyl-L-alanyl-D-glutamate--2,6-diaminopimelate ligase